MQIFSLVRSAMETKHRLIAMSMLRIALGLYMLAFYAMHLFQYGVFWGVNGIVSYVTFRDAMFQTHDVSLFLLSPSDAVGKALIACGIIVTLLYTLGWRTRLMSVLFYIFTWSVYRRDYYILNGGDNLLYILAFYMMFVDAGAYFSLDAGRAKPNAEPKAYSFRNLLHNFGVLAIVIQLCVLYLTSAFFKVQGHMWQDGTAIYYVLRSNQFNLTPAGRALYHNGVLVALLTYSTLLFQAAWPWLIWNRYARPVLALGALSLHLSIAYFMGLYWFSFVMIASECVIFSDFEYVAFSRWLDRVWLRVRGSTAVYEPQSSTS